MYIDLDFVCNRSIDDLMNTSFFAVPEISEHQIGQEVMICCGFFGAAPEHPNIWKLIQEIVTSNDTMQPPKSVLEKTGPIMWGRTLSVKDTVAKGSLIMPFTDQGTLTKDYNGEEPIFAYTLWFEGSGWGSGEGFLQKELDSMNVNMRNTLSTLLKNVDVRQAPENLKNCANSTANTIVILSVSLAICVLLILILGVALFKKYN